MNRGCKEFIEKGMLRNGKNYTLTVEEQFNDWLRNEPNKEPILMTSTIDVTGDNESTDTVIKLIIYWRER